MKKMVFLFVSLCWGFTAFAQDVIVLRNGDEIEAIIQEINIDSIKYKRYSNQEGPTITVAKSDVFMIKYANGEKETFKEEPPKTAANAVISETDNFTSSERGGTWAVNVILPGLGSYIIMRDWLGGSIHLGTNLLGWILVGYAASTFGEIGYTTYTYYGGSSYQVPYAKEPEYEILAIGIVVLVGDFIFNIVRSVTYDKPAPTVSGGFDPRNIDIAIQPGKKGIEQVALSYTLRF